ncbi:MAG TPA: NADH dehydrogenase ubiquinone Fe-S protein 4 [Allosphingosinicella sp.]|uniref:NADH dehydrogenase ubiquinone Fe-S protein 4 n=1 Tax=Allosphingosinicella sp. TaxID=2823234 RepID=UPI002F27073F
MAARIFQQFRAVNQSGDAHTGHWVLEFESHSRARPDPLTGWAGGTDTQTQVSLDFDTLEQAKDYAERSGIAYHVVPSTTRKLRLQSYADNFK